MHAAERRPEGGRRERLVAALGVGETENEDRTIAAPASAKQCRADARVLLSALRGAPRARAAFLKELALVTRPHARAGHPFLDNTTPNPPATPASAKNAPATGLAALVSTAKASAKVQRPSIEASTAPRPIAKPRS